MLGGCSPLVIDLGVDILESFELEEVLGIGTLVPDVLRFDKLFSLHLGLRVTDLDVIASWCRNFLVMLETLVAVLQVGTGGLSEIVANDALDRCLRSVWPSEGKLVVWQ